MTEEAAGRRDSWTSGVPRLSRPVVMGVVNVTPDSFSDGGLHDTTDAAIAHALMLRDRGADVLDVGGSRPVPVRRGRWWRTSSAAWCR